MRKFTLLFAFLLCFSISYAQKIKTNPNVGLVDREHYGQALVEQSNYKFEGEVFYLETFDFADETQERGWSLPEGWQIVDDNDHGHYWTWRAGTDSIKGRYTFEPGHIYSKTPEDGYFVLPMDEFQSIDGGNLGLGGNAWFQMAPIDCSTHPSVVMKLRQNFRGCCGLPDIKVRISNDQGVHWADFDMRFGTNTNVFCEKPIVEINISEVAAGMPDVWIQFLWNGNSHYFWCIDDFELSEGYNNELQLEDSWVYMSDLVADDNNEGYFFMTPLTQINDVLGGWSFRGALLNAGMEDAWGVNLNAEIWKNGTSVYNETSDNGMIAAIDRDTFNVTTPYFPDEYGSYKMKLTAQMEATDGVPMNNVYEDWFHVGDSVYSICDWDLETYSSTASWSNKDGDMLGCVYEITSDVEVNSISTMIMQRQQNPQASTQVGYGYQAWIYYWDADDQIYIPLISSDFYEVTEETLNNWVTIPLEKDGESEFLFAGEEYIAAIQGFHYGPSGDNNTWRFTLGSDLDHKYNDGKSVWMDIGDESWYTNDTDLSMVRMNLNVDGAPTTCSVVFNVDMNIPITNGYFHPEWGEFVDISGSFNGWGDSEHMTDEDGDGIYTLTVDNIPVFEAIEYKYRINANWDTSEFPLGGPNRVYITHYYNETDDEYNDGVALSINVEDLTQSLKVYPNPTDGLFSLEVQNKYAASLDISVVNIHGQVVYQNLVHDVFTHNEQIDLTTFAKGMYFLKVNNSVTKLMVK